ncbi:hypothetical protein NLU13_3996 [Sarocladium strictum]|uniref:Aromatic prenyltransferase n=1 Tax=Sarocladium strictum TaxID=5046 RepID=A0AA39L7T0_SARSR|nr:hypothetical protein NLU13_3996 [Sarocladium strictum]
MASSLLSHLKLWLNRVIQADGINHQEKQIEKTPVQWQKSRQVLVDDDCELWNQEIGSQLATMLEMAEYSASSQVLHTDFFLNSVSPFLGYHPKGEKPLPHIWKSFMTDDHTPVELSWAWSSGDRKAPVVRYSVEPISRAACRGLDMDNVDANVRMLGEALRIAPDMDLCLHRHFRKALTASRGSTAGRGQLDQDASVASAVPQAQCFIAFDLQDDHVVVKQYYIPNRRSMELGCDNWRLVRDALLNIPAAWMPRIDPALSVLTEFIGSFDADKAPTVEIMAVDCIDPAQSRLKIYCRSRSTSFDSVVHMLALGGRKPLQADERSALWDLWMAVFSLTPETYSSAEQGLPEKGHRTAGLLYYYELKANSSCPKSKVYLPVRHYAQNDDQIARGLSSFLEARGKGFKSGSYYDAVRKLCKNRNLSDGLGFHTYVSWAGDKGKWNITAYFNPQSYSI